jgi:2-(3-amino-3-carboxypropyl)histidine synthase
MDYDLELGRVIASVKKAKLKTICIQLPDGLKPKAKEIADEVELKTGAKVYIWLGSCYGGCDLPIGLDKLSIEMIVQWGHSEF